MRARRLGADASRTYHRPHPPVPAPCTPLHPLASPPSPAGKVILTVKSAHNMKDKAWLGKSDPYW